MTEVHRTLIKLDQSGLRHYCKQWLVDWDPYPEALGFRSTDSAGSAHRYHLICARDPNYGDDPIDSHSVMRWQLVRTTAYGNLYQDDAPLLEHPFTATAMVAQVMVQEQMGWELPDHALYPMNDLDVSVGAQIADQYGKGAIWVAGSFDPSIETTDGYPAQGVFVRPFRGQYANRVVFRPTYDGHLNGEHEVVPFVDAPVTDALASLAYYQGEQPKAEDEEIVVQETPQPTPTDRITFTRRIIPVNLVALTKHIGLPATEAQVYDLSRPTIKSDLPFTRIYLVHVQTPLSPLSGGGWRAYSVDANDQPETYLTAHATADDALVFLSGWLS